MTRAPCFASEEQERRKARRAAPSQLSSAVHPTLHVKSLQHCKGSSKKHCNIFKKENLHIRKCTKFCKPEELNSNLVSTA